MQACERQFLRLIKTQIIGKKSPNRNGWPGNPGMLNPAKPTHETSQSIAWNPISKPEISSFMLKKAVDYPLLSIWGFFVIMRFPHDDWILLPLLQTFYYVLGPTLKAESYAACYRRLPISRLFPYPNFNLYLPYSL
jgi:hypothetical protein